MINKPWLACLSGLIRCKAGNVPEEDPEEEEGVKDGGGLSPLQGGPEMTNIHAHSFNKGYKTTQDEALHAMPPQSATTETVTAVPTVT